MRDLMQLYNWRTSSKRSANLFSETSGILELTNHHKIQLHILLSVQYVGAEEVSATQKSVLNKGGEYVIVGKLKNDVDTLNFKLIGKGGSGTYEASETICYLARPFGKTCLPARENPAR